MFEKRVYFSFRRLLAVTVALEEVVLSYDTNLAETELTFYCNPILKDVVDPRTVVVEITWYSGTKVVHEEEFNLETRSVGKLTQDKWSVGSSLHCTARAKHSVVGAKTNAISSKPFFAGIKIESSDLILEEGKKEEAGSSNQEIRLSSTIPIICEQEGLRSRCCVQLEIEVNTWPVGYDVTNSVNY